jgi:flagellar basal-body rod protein FlgB
MNEISENSIMAALGRQMTQAVQKQAVAAGNLANLDTPGFKTREISFDDLLDGEIQKLELAQPHSGTGVTSSHITTLETSEAAGLDARLDGNNVQLDRELLAMTRASGEFAAAQTAMAAKFRLIRFAINEGSR